MNAPRLMRIRRLAAERLEDRTVPAVFDVTTTADTGPGSLRQAITDANAMLGLDTIRFLIGNGVQTIQVPALGPSLPAITDPVDLDGTTQPGFAGTPLIEIDFNGTLGLLLDLGSDGSSMQGLALLNSSDTTPGLQVLSDGNAIAANYFGLRADGVTFLGNLGGGVTLEGNGNTFGGATLAEGNFVSGNVGTGVAIFGGVTNNLLINNVVSGNDIGVTISGTGTATNDLDSNAITDNVGAGVAIFDEATDSLIIRNLIDGNGDFGVIVSGLNTSLNFIVQNAISNNVAGGVLLTDQVDNTLIGGQTPGDSNTFADNGVAHVVRDATAGDGNGILRNEYSGTIPVIDNDPDDLVAVPQLTSVSTVGGFTTVTGVIVGGVPGMEYLIEVYAAATQGPGGESTGGIFFGDTTVTADANGDATFTLNSPQVDPTAFYSATATDLADNTSEFGPARPVDPVVVIQRLIAVGAGQGGGPHVKVYNTDGSLRFQFFAYDVGFTGGVRVATADIDGDSIEDIITGPGVGGGPHVRVFSGLDGALLTEFMAYEPEFTGGIYVAGDDSGIIATTPGVGGGPLLRAFDAINGGFTELFVYDSAFRGGAYVAFTPDLDGDGFADILTGAGPGGGPHVKAFSLSDPFQLGQLTLNQVTEFFALDPTTRNGVTVAGGDFNGDGIGDALTGYGIGQFQFTIGPVPPGFVPPPFGPPFAPPVSTTTPVVGVYLATGFGFNFAALLQPFGPGTGVGLNVASIDLNGDGFDDPIVGRATGETTVLVLDAATSIPLLTLADPFPGFLGGVFVG